MNCPRSFKDPIRSGWCGSSFGTSPGCLGQVNCCGFSCSCNHVAVVPSFAAFISLLVGNLRFSGAIARVQVFALELQCTLPALPDNCCILAPIFYDVTLPTKIFFLLEITVFGFLLRNRTTPLYRFGELHLLNCKYLLAIEDGSICSTSEP